MSENEELAKLIDGAYKNILEKFNPCARQLIAAGKAYLKALHGSVSASKTYIEAISKLARNAHQGTWGGCTDIGTALMQLVEVQKELQAQQMNILKAFYVDLLVPLESNIEKDTKVVLCVQKKFLQQHKSYNDAYIKAVTLIKKQKKKNRCNRGSNLEKEVKHINSFEEEKSKLDSFCEQSLKEAITQERRRYGFVLERQCSLTKHYLVYHSQGQSLLQQHLDQWDDIIKTREILPESIEKLFPSTDDITIGNEYASPSLLIDDHQSRFLRNPPSSLVGIRKTRSIDASCSDLREFVVHPFARPLSRAKSDFNIASSSTSLVSSEYVPLRPKSMAESDGKPYRRYVKALYSYLSSGEHQLSFHEGDVIALIGERNKGWHYGENLRNHRCGWFPIAYTEVVKEKKTTEETNKVDHRHSTDLAASSIYEVGVSRSKTIPNIRPYTSNYASVHVTTQSLPPPPTMQRPMSTFVDTYASRTTEFTKICTNTPNSKPQTLPPTPTTHLGPGLTPIVSVPSCQTLALDPLPVNLRPPRRSQTSPLPHPSSCLPVASSLHSSNDSGFCNDSFPQGTSSNPVEGEDRSRDNMFSSVKLRKVVTNDRSAPMIT